jgi:hypothetical protein
MTHTQLGGPGLLHPLFQANFAKTSKASVAVSSYKQITAQRKSEKAKER